MSENPTTIFRNDPIGQKAIDLALEQQGGSVEDFDDEEEDVQAPATDDHPFDWDRTVGQALYRLLKVIAPAWHMDGVEFEEGVRVRITITDPEENVWLTAIGSRDDPE